MTDDKKTDDEQIDRAVAAFRKIADQHARDRRERIATAVLAGLSANAARADFSIDDDVIVAIKSANRLIEELEKEGGR